MTRNRTDSNEGVNLVELEYRSLTLEDKSTIDRINRSQNQTISTYSFPVLFCWQEPLEMLTAVEEDFFVVRHRTRPEYFFPCGRADMTRQFLDDLITAEAPFTLFHLGREQADWVREQYPMLKIWEDRDNFDYLYTTQMLSQLPGKSYRNLRQEFHQIDRLSPVQTSPLTPENLEQFWALTRSWADQNDLDADAADLIATRTALDHYWELGLEGLLIYDERGPVSAIIGSALSDTMFDCHFTKSIGTLPGHGSYAFHAIAKQMESRFPILNLEEDLGIPGLRYKKTILKPSELLPVYCCSNTSNPPKERDEP